MTIVDDTDLHGLETLARSWNPRSMRTDLMGAALLDALNAALGDILNPLIDMEAYAPIILNPTRCLDNDIDRILALNGITRARSLSADQARRLAVIAQPLRSWRGAFRSLRSVIGSLVGGPVIIRSWLLQRVVIDETTWSMVLLDPMVYQDTTQAFLLGSGPNSSYDSGQVESHVRDLARTILDDTQYVACYALTAWRDGFAGWGALGDIALITTSVTGEYESADLGPDVGSTAVLHRLTSPTGSTDGATKHCVTVWFKTMGATALSTWRVEVMSNGNTPVTCFAADVSVGNGTISLVKIIAGIETVLLTETVNVPDGDGDWHRVDLQTVVGGGATKIRAYIDNDPTGWAKVNGPPLAGSLHAEIVVDNALFPTGRLRVAALTAVE